MVFCDQRRKPCPLCPRAVSGPRLCPRCWASSASSLLVRLEPNGCTTRRRRVSARPMSIADSLESCSSTMRTRLVASSKQPSKTCAAWATAWADRTDPRVNPTSVARVVAPEVEAMSEQEFDYWRDWPASEKRVVTGYGQRFEPHRVGERLCQHLTSPRLPLQRGAAFRWPTLRRLRARLRPPRRHRAAQHRAEKRLRDRERFFLVLRCRRSRVHHLAYNLMRRWVSAPEPRHDARETAIAPQSRTEPVLAPAERTRGSIVSSPNPLRL